MRELRLAGVFAGALLGAGVGLLAASPVAESLPGAPSRLLLSAVVALVAAPAAAWTANLAAGTPTRTRVGSCLLVTLGASLLVGLGALSLGPGLGWSEQALSWASALVVAAAATAAAASYRVRRRGAPVGDAVATLIILALVPALLGGIRWVAPRFEQLQEQTATVGLSDEEEEWCDENRRQVLEVARVLGAEEVPDLPTDEAMLEWRAREPRRYHAACVTAYQAAH